QRGVPRSGVWSEVETGRSGTSGGAGEETMDGRRAVAEWKPPARNPAFTQLEGVSRHYYPSTLGRR
ncbi:MAG: hypothetical protein ACYC37_05955, partial [Desulfobacteria bacterium]